MDWNAIFENVKVSDEESEKMTNEYKRFKNLVKKNLEQDKVEEAKIAFVGAANDIAAIRNRPFRIQEREKLINSWPSVVEYLTNLINSIGKYEDIEQNYNEFETSIFELCKDAKDSQPKAATLRLAASVLPEYLSSIASEKDMDELIRDLLKNGLITNKDILNKTAFEKSHFILYTIKTNYLSPQKDDSDKRYYCLPWKILEYFRGEDMVEIETLLRNHKNIILTGAPGTGKTYLAKKVASYVITGNGDIKSLTAEEKQKFESQYKFVQFHPSYDYTDFVEGLRPIDKGKGEIKFERKDGIFKAFCAEAAKNIETDNKYVFVIDEINRGEISKIFGELFFSIDPGYRGEFDNYGNDNKVDTQYQNLIKKDGGDYPFKLGFYVPTNVYVIGTMNDIDRSVESMDFAFRRRFAFHEVTAESTAKQILMGVSNYEVLIKKMKALNKAIIDPQIGGLSKAYQIGASYFKKYEEIAGGKENKYKTLFRVFIKGVLYEYFRGLPQKEVDEKMKKLEKAYDDAGKDNCPIKGVRPQEEESKEEQ